jgi:hypothetical protein
VVHPLFLKKNCWCFSTEIGAETLGNGTLSLLFGFSIGMFSIFIG